jgi:hypothetical protein
MKNVLIFSGLFGREVLEIPSSYENPKIGTFDMVSRGASNAGLDTSRQQGMTIPMTWKSHSLDHA